MIDELNPISILL